MYLNIIQLAESFGVEESVVESWVRKESLPAIEDRGRLLFDRAQVVAWAAERGRVAKAGFLAPTRPAASPGRRIETLLRTGGIWRDVPAAELFDVLERIVSGLAGVTPEVRKIFVQRLRAAGGINWAPVGHGLALPHLRAHVALGRDSGLVAILFLREALSLAEATPDGVPVSRLLFFIAPSPRAHLEMLAQLSAALTRGALRPLVLKGAPDAEIFAALAGSEAEPAAKEKEATP
jgi:PTS system nitrogen regulatory IIA component